MAIPTTDCFRGLDFNKQLRYIYEALYNISGVDPDAQLYFSRSGVTDSTAKNRINSFILGLKSEGLFDLLTGCWICRSAYNAGIGTIVYDLKSDLLNGVFVGSPTWGTDGILFDNTAEAVTTGRIQTMNGSWSAFSVFKMPTASAANRRIFGAAAAADPTLLVAQSATTSATPIATYDGGSLASSVATINIVNFSMVGQTYSVANKQIFYQGAAQFGTAAVANVAASRTIQLSSSSGEGASDMTISVAMIFGATELTGAQEAALYNIIKTTICVDQGLP